MKNLQILLLAAITTTAAAQAPIGADGIRVTSTAIPGGTITINIGTTDATVQVGILGSPEVTSHHVSANKDTQLTVPDAAPGTLIIVIVGKGRRARRLLVTLVAPTP